ncbi:Potassium channel subfamily U member 1 [Chelonia mydas]|uniref:Potassium channel subfamily U member 1 n=1 Tax=Chelonia mydas TaxID=8469 RepID=M7C0S2_CHEMY|nr:Potassium channel subfamily U member 1 [Chelonia mydas]
MSFNAFFLFYFGLRFMAANNKLSFWLELNSIVDFFTIPPVCVSYYLKRNCLGLRFLRALRLLELPKILQFLRITRTSNSIKLSRLLAAVLSTWLTAAGFIHLVENSGDPWVHHQNSQSLSYFDCLYLTMVTMSTVGFGDVVTKTSLGRIFMIFFIIGGLVLFANFIPEIVDIVGGNRKYQESYEVVRGRKYIVVCGDITLKSVTAFLRNFLAQDTGDVCTEIVFLGEQVYLANIPNWDWRRGDSIICFAELKLGFIAQSCLVPGLSTLLRSLFIRQKSTKVKRKGPWNRNLFEGNDYKVMTDWLSNDFVNMTFPDVCRFCFVKLDLVLLAVEFRTGIHENSLLVNPSAQIKLNRNTMGFFIAKSKVEVKRAHFYCKACHSDIDNPELIKICHCRRKPWSRSFSVQYKSPFLVFKDAYELIPANLTDFISLSSVCHSLRSVSFSPACHCWVAAAVAEEESQALLDSTGMFHWCKAVPLEQALLKPQRQTTSPLHDHIVVCVFGDANSTLIGLRNFVMPLRASNFTYQELKDIVFLGSLEYMKREWTFIQNFPKLLLFPGSALSCADLRAVNIRYCTMCTILSSHVRASTNPTLVDTENILATLNIRSMQFKSSSTAGEAVGRVRTLENESEPSYKRIPIITELNTTSNVQFIDHHISSDSQIPEQELYLSSTGGIFSDSFLDSLLSTTYRDHHVLALLQTLVTGGTSPELEEQLAEKNVLCGSFTNTAYVAPRARCKLALMPLSKRLLTDSRSCWILIFWCFSRYAIARPPSDFKMLPTDMVFCIVPFSTTATSDLSVCEEDLSPRRHQSHTDSSIKQN